VTVTTSESRIATTFARLKAENQTGVIPYLTVGYPELDTVQRVAPAMVEGGAAMIELGIPFSDPLADGATVQHSSFEALKNGVSVEYCLETARQLRESGVDVPLAFMGYFNPIFSFGLDRFAEKCAEIGVDGLIIPDLPVGESRETREACRRGGRDLIFMLAPTSTDELIGATVQQASGFIYCVSLTGTTGARSSLAEGLGAFLSRVRSRTELPLAVGFGISQPEHVAEVGKIAEAVAVGSAVIDRLGSTPRERQPEVMRDFVRYLRGE
jgi:tryptophan synthase alpha chain